jgi:hypothetical protein
MLHTLLERENFFTDTAQANLFVAELFSSAGRRRRQKLRRQLLDKIAHFKRLSRHEMQRQLRNKFNGRLPYADGERISYLASYMMPPDPSSMLCRLTEMGDEQKFLHEFNILAEQYGYSYGGSSRPSMRLQTQRCSSALLDEKLSELSRAISVLLNVCSRHIQRLDVQNALYHKAPKYIMGYAKQPTEHRSVVMFRPDVIVKSDGQFRFTEIEGVPGGHGILGIHQLLLEGQSKLVEQFAKYLNGRPYRIILCREMLDYLWEQAAFCNMLQDLKGVDAKVIIAATEDEFRSHAQLWKAQYCHEMIMDPIAHLQQSASKATAIFDRELISSLQGTVVFRFGYFRNFTSPQLRQMEDADEVLNSMLPHLESKNLLAFSCSALCKELYESDGLIDDYHALQQFTVPTELVSARTMSLTSKSVLKISGWHVHDWGSKSVRVSSEMSRADWKTAVYRYGVLEQPAVMQDFIDSAKFSIRYIAPDSSLGVVTRARLRATPIVLGTTPLVTGMTFRRNARVHGATDAIQGILVSEDCQRDSEMNIK